MNKLYETIYNQSLRESTPFELDFNAEDWDDSAEKEIFSTLYNAFEMAKKRMGSKYGHQVLSVAKEVISELNDIYGSDETRYDSIEN